MTSLEGHKHRVKDIMKVNGWQKTPNVTLLEAVKKIIEATDKWRSCYPPVEVTKSITESVFFLLATCNEIGDFDLDKILEETCEAYKSYDFKDVPDDIIWSFITYQSEPHTPYRSPNRPREFKP